MLIDFKLLKPAIILKQLVGLTPINIVVNLATWKSQIVRCCGTQMDPINKFSPHCILSVQFKEWSRVRFSGFKTKSIFNRMDLLCLTLKNISSCSQCSLPPPSTVSPPTLKTNFLFSWIKCSFRRLHFPVKVRAVNL